MPSTKDFILTFKPIVSPEPYIQAYYEEFNGDLYIYEDKHKFKNQI